MSLLYLEIINLETQFSIGTYEIPELNNTPLKSEIESKSKELISQIKPENRSVKKKLNFKNDPNKTIDIYYLSTNDGILYLSFIELSSSNMKTFKENFIYELLENIESQNIKKFVDDDEKLSNVGLQNLKMSIDNYNNTYSHGSGNESLIEEDQQSQKISIINSQINDVKNDMKQNVKNMITNMNDMNEIEGKSVTIKDSSFHFQQDAKNLENKMKRQACKNKIILFVAVACLIGIIIYVFMK